MSEIVLGHGLDTEPEMTSRLTFTLDTTAPTSFLRIRPCGTPSLCCRAW